VPGFAHEQEDLIDAREFVDPTSGRVVASYAHPLFWAAFALVGPPD
jgi:CHAT domain-containing protein